jgi:hypothetical protein
MHDIKDSDMAPDMMEVEQHKVPVLNDVHSPERIVAEKKLLKKIDIRLMPMLMLICESPAASLYTPTMLTWQEDIREFWLMSP